MESKTPTKVDVFCCLTKAKKRYLKIFYLSSSKTRSFALVNALHLKVPLNCYGSTAVECHPELWRFSAIREGSRKKVANLLSWILRLRLRMTLRGCCKLREEKKMRYMMFLLGLMFANVANAIDCEKVPTCEELGYSTEDDPYCADNGYMYCPLDYSYKKCVNYDCAKMGFTDSDKTSWCGKLIKCKGNESFTACACIEPQPEPCAVGSVYYANGACSSVEKYQGCGIPVGVVYYVTDNGTHGKVINLKDLGKSAGGKFNPADPYNNSVSKAFVWGIENDISNLKNWYCNSFKSVAQTEDRTAGFWSEGKNYTNIIASYQNDDLQYPAPAAKKFYPPEVEPKNPIVGQEKWYLPTIGELMDLFGYDYQNLGIDVGCDEINTGATGEIKKIVNNTLSTLKNNGVDAEELTEKKYSSSSEFDAKYSWTLDMKDGTRTFHSKHYGFSVRTSLAF